MTIPSFTETRLRPIATLLAEAVSHADLTGILTECRIAYATTDGPRWHRILTSLSQQQRRDGCGNNVVRFIQEVMDSARWVNAHERFDFYRTEVNKLLAFDGLQVRESGEIQVVSRTATISEAQERARNLRAELCRRGVHPEVLKFCRAELLQDNFFHAVFEATKSISERIRQQSGLTEDGAELVQRAFSVRGPILALNSLRTETERSEQRGFVKLLVGVFGTFRNVTAHAPKITWPISEQDALDLLTIASYVHRRLDNTARVPPTP